MLPSTVERVPSQTADAANASIHRQTDQNIARYQQSGNIDRRLRELDYEWDIERTLEANAAIACVAGVFLGSTVDRRWFYFPAVIGGFLLQHALQGWCPPLPVFRRLGIRTAAEIDRERDALLRAAGSRQ